METLKNFGTGLLVLILGMIMIGLTLLFWPLLAGITSFVLSIMAGLLFLVMIFYLIVLIGYISRQLFKKS
jgi:membrane protein implicated in regulation of membrane protease activity